MRKNRSRAPQTRSLQLASVAAAPGVSSIGHPEEKQNELKRTCAPELQEALEKRRNGQVCAVEQSL